MATKEPLFSSVSYCRACKQNVTPNSGNLCPLCGSRNQVFAVIETEQQLNAFHSPNNPHESIINFALIFAGSVFLASIICFVIVKQIDRREVHPQIDQAALEEQRQFAEQQRQETMERIGQAARESMERMKASEELEKKSESTSTTRSSRDYHLPYVNPYRDERYYTPAMQAEMKDFLKSIGQPSNPTEVNKALRMNEVMERSNGN